MRIVIDPTKCDGYGTCNELCPEIFKLDEWGYAYVEAEEPAIAEHAEDVGVAQRGCPSSAIRVE
jgi:ferredoxin